MYFLKKGEVLLAFMTYTSYNMLIEIIDLLKKLEKGFPK